METRTIKLLCIVIAACGVTACNRASSQTSTTPPVPMLASTVEDETPAPSHEQPNSPRSIKVRVTINSPADLRVKAGQQIAEGDVMADRAAQRAGLLAQRQQAQLTLDRLLHLAERSDTGDRPTLPTANFAEHEANIRRAELAHAAVVRAAEIQEKRINEIGKLPFPVDLEAVKQHETAKLAQLAQQEREAQANLELARAQLETARASRAYTESKDKLEIQRQHIAQSEQRQQRETLIAQTRAQLTTLDQQISALAAVRAPFGGTVKKIQWEGQSNAEISVVITVDVGGDAGERAER